MERLGDTVRGALQGVGIPDAGDAADVVRIWPHAVGAAISRAAWPQRITREGKLVVATTSSTWAFELGRMESELLERLRRTLPGVTLSGLRFVPGPVPEPPAAAAPADSADPPEIDPDIVRSAAAAAAEIEDEELRETIARAAALSLARARADRRF